MQALTLRVYNMFIPDRGGALSWLDAAACLLLSVAASAVLYRLIEQPFERALRGAGRRSALAP